MIWITKDLIDLGYLPDLISEDDPRPTREQIATKYLGGWNSMDGFTLDKKTLALKYPGDPPLYPIASTLLRQEMIYLYPHDWLLVLQPDGAFEISRVD